MKLLLLLAFFVSSLNAAQNDLKEVLGELTNPTINSMMIFTSQDSVNSGSYNFSNIDSDLTILHAPFVLNLKPFTPRWNIFLMGGAGYGILSAHNIYNANGVDILDGLSLINYSAGIGSGIRYQTDFGLSFAAGIEIIYSLTSFAAISSDSSAQEIIDSINNLLKAEHTQSFSNKSIVKIEYDKIFNNYRPYASISASFYGTNTSFDLEDIISLSSNSSLYQLKGGFESPHLYNFTNNQYLTIESYISGNLLDGTVKDVLETDHYFMGGVVGYLYSKEYLKFAHRYFIEYNILEGKGISGYNLGLGFSIDF